MTSLNVFRTDTGVHIFTDGAVFDVTSGGAMVCAAVKPEILPWSNGIVVSTGSIETARAISFVIGTYSARTFDEQVLRFPDATESAASMLRKAGHQNTEQFEAVIAGWSESTERPAAFVVRGFRNLGHAPYQLNPIGDFRSPQAEWGAPRLTFDPASPEQSGVSILEQQRRQLCEARGATDIHFHAAGAFVHHTTVARDAITMRILHRWPDVIGERIDLNGVEWRGSSKSCDPLPRNRRTTG